MAPGKTLRQSEQVRRRRAGEAVDRLVPVAHCAELVSVAEPALEQRLLEQVDVLVLVDREREVALAEGLRRLGPLVVEPDGELQQVLEVGQPLRALDLFVSLVDAQHQVRGDRRVVVGERVAIALGRDAAVPGPLDLGREVAARPEPERHRQRIGDVPESQGLRGQDAPDRRGREVAKLRERRGVERPRLHSLGAERPQTASHLAGSLVGERDGEDLSRLERAGRDLVGNAPCDRGRLARARAGEDADRSADQLGRAPLLGIQARENVFRPHPFHLRRATGRRPRLRRF